MQPVIPQPPSTSGECCPLSRYDLNDVARLRFVHLAKAPASAAATAAAADVGIATGTGVAMSCLQVTLVKVDLRRILQARAISDATVRNTKQNLAFAFLCSALGVPLTSGVLYAALGSLLSPMVGALAMSLSSFPLITNTLWLANVPRPQSIQ